MGIRHAALTAGVALGLFSGAAHAAYVIDINQVGSDVVARGSGSLDLSGFTFLSPDNERAFILPSFPAIVIGSGNGDLYSGIVDGPGSFGPGSLTFASLASGNIFGFSQFGGGRVLVPNGYSSGDAVGVSTAAFTNATFATLGLTPGTYVYTLEPQISFAVADFAAVDPNTITLNIGGVSTVPLPASAPMFGAALMAVGAVGYGLKRKKASAAA